MRLSLKFVLLALGIGLSWSAWSKDCRPHRSQWHQWIRDQWHVPEAPRHFSAGEFPHSSLWHYAQSHLFPKWAAAVASAVTDQVKEVVSLKKIFDYTAQERTRLAKTMRDSVRELFGVELFGIPRKQGQKIWNAGASPDSWSSGICPVCEEKRTPLQWEFYALIAPLIALGPIRDTEEAIMYANNHYVPLTGLKLPASTLTKTKWLQYYRVQHPSPRESQIIFNDVIRRLEAIRSQVATGNLTDQTEAFLYAMHGYYNATPYYRGSSAIGRVFFAGFYLAVFGKKLPSTLPEGIDVRAMLMSTEDFIRTFLPHFEESATSTPAIHAMH